MKRGLILIVLLLAMTLTSGCGSRGGGSDDGGTTGPPSGPSTGTDPDSGEVRNLGDLILVADADLIPADGSTAAIISLTTFNEDDGVLGGVSFSAAVSGNAGISGNLGSTDAKTGKTSFRVTSDTAENVILTVTAGEISKTLPLHFGAYLSLGPQTVTATGSTTLTAILKDGTNQPITGRQINFKFGESNDDTLVPAGSTGEDGRVSTTVTDVGNNGGIDTVVATTGKISSDPATITFRPSIDEENLFLEVSAPVQVLDVGEPAQIVASIVNDRGTPVSGKDISFTAFPATADVDLSATTGRTNSDGEVPVSVTGNKAENITFRASIGSASLEIPLYYGAKVVLNYDKKQTTANGASPITLSATVRDAYGVAVPSIPVDFRVTEGDEALLAHARVLTGADGGPARNTLTGTTIENARVQATAGTVAPAAADFAFVPGAPEEILLTSEPAAPLSLSIYGAANIIATISDSLGNPVADNTPVTFETTLGSIQTEALTKDGKAEALFDAQAVSGTAEVTVRAGAVASTYTVGIQPAETTGTIVLDAVDPADRTIHVAGTEGNRLATVRFRVTDVAGNPVANGTSVLIYVDPTALGGGEMLSAGGAYAEKVVASTSNGIATVTLRSGSVAGTADIVAVYDPDGETEPDVFDGNEISTIARVLMVGGMPDSRHFNLAAEFLNVAGGVTSGLQDTITAYLGDRFGNVPLDGTPVSFYSECGSIGDSSGFLATTEHGEAITHLHTMAPTTPALGGIDKNPENRNLINNVGRCTIMAMTPGAEFFEDKNGNGVYDEGDVCSGDQAEPFIDANANGAYDDGEFYIDVDGGGSFTEADSDCQSNTMIWTSMQIMISDYASPLNVWDVEEDVPASGFELPIGGSKTFSVDFADLWGNALVAGTSITVQTDAGSLSGLESHEQADTISVGHYRENPDGDNAFRFTLHSDIEPDAEPTQAKVTVTLTPASGAQGNNGAAQIVTLAGTINRPLEGEAYIGEITIDALPDVIANGDPVQVRALVEDLNGNPASGVSVVFSSPGGTFTASSDPFDTDPIETNGSGFAFAYFHPGTKAGDFDITASSGGVFSATGITILPAAPEIQRIDVSPLQVGFGGTAKVTVRVVDAFGNSVAGATVDFAVTGNSGGTALSAPSAATDEQGLATVDFTAGGMAAATETVTATVSGVSQTATIVVTPPDVVVDAVSVQLARPTLKIGSANLTTRVFALVVDQEGNPVPGKEVTFSAPLDAAIAPASASTDASGMAVADLTIGTRAGTGDVLATAGAVTGAATLTVLPGDPAHVTLSASPGKVKPTATATISALVTDAEGNPVPGADLNFSVSANESGASLAGGSTVTDAAGRASVAYTAGNAEGTDTVQAVTGTTTGSVDILVDPQGIVVTSLEVVASPTQFPADGVSISMVTATVRDQDDAPAAGIPVGFTAVNGLGDLLTLTHEETPLSGPVLTDADGRARVFYRAGDAPGIEALEVTAGVFTKTVTMTLTDKATFLTLAVDTDHLTADGASTTNVTARVTDSNHVPLPDLSITFSTTGGVLDSNMATTDADGTATATLTAPASLGTAVVMATVAGLNDSATVQFVPGEPERIVLSAAPQTIAFHAQTTVKAVVLDANGFPVVDTPVYFSLAGNSSDGYFQTQQGTTDNRGEAFITYVSGTAEGVDTLRTETDNGTSATIDVTVDPDAAVIGSLVLTAENDSLVANGSTETQVRAIVTDLQGLPMQGVPVNFSTSAGELTPNTDPAAPRSEIVVTDADGAATLFLQSGTKPELAQLRASTGGFNEETEVRFIPGPPHFEASDFSTLTASPSAMLADGVSTSTVTATLVDDQGNPVADGTPVTLIYSNVTLLSENPVTTLSGRATFEVQAPLSGSEAQLSIAELSGPEATISFGADSGGEPASIVLEAAEQHLFVAGVGKKDRTSIFVNIYEANGAPIEERFYTGNTAKVSFTSRPGGGEYLSGVNADGDVVTTLTDGTIDIVTQDGTAALNLVAGTLPGAVEIKVQAINSVGALMPGVTASLPQVNIASGPPHTITLAHPVSNAIENLGGGVYRRSGTAIVTDRYGNAVPDGTIINLGLVDSLISYGNASGTTTSGEATLTGAGGDFLSANLNDAARNNTPRYIQNNDRVLLLDAPAADKSRFVSNVDGAGSLTVNKPYLSAGIYDYLVGSSLLGSYISGFDEEGGLIQQQGVTKEGLAPFRVTYNANVDTILTGCYGYRGGNGPEDYNNDDRFNDPKSAQVYVVASSSDDGAITVNQGDFCFGAIAPSPSSLVAAPAALIQSGTVTLSLVDGGDGIPLPQVPITSSVTVTNVGTYEACSDGVSPDQATCEGEDETWTADIPSDFDLTVTGCSETGLDGTCTATITVFGGLPGDSATVTFKAGNATAPVTVTLP